jgi:hypothetical protein
MKRIILGILAIFTCGLFCMTPVFADDNNCVPTNILGENGEMCDDGKGSSVKEILLLVIDIMTIGIGILGVIGITVVGIQYLTAGGDPGKVQKSKQRMLEIVIGLVIYVVIYALLKWLLPGFSL